ncbi:MAG: nuclear transport factor 2 family protein [Bdellovibrionales bacterium]|nr:nuclear transport factor 2 family protein [Bdellovibrionales bacterium]
MKPEIEQKELVRLLDERAIERLINRFDLATTERDVETFKTLWTEDAVWEIKKPLFSKSHGKGEIVSMLAKLYEPLDFFFRTTQNPVIDFRAEGHSATGTAQTIEVARMTNGKSYANVALYRDEYRKVSGSWLFSGRHYDYIWVETELPLVGQSLTVRKD